MTNELLWKLRKVHEEVGVVEDKLFYEFWPKALLSLLISMQSLWWWSSQAPCHLMQWAKNKQKKWTIWFLFATKLVVTWHLSLEARLVLFMSTFWCQFFGVNWYIPKGAVYTRMWLLFVSGFLWWCYDIFFCIKISKISKEWF